MLEQKLTDKSELTVKELIILIVASIVTLTVVSTCSPIYPFNPGDDINVFFTVGRCIKHGMIPYRDVFDHKGPILYFIYFLASLISEKSFTGVWIIECLVAATFAVFSWKTVKLFVTPSKVSLLFMPVLLGLIYTSGMVDFGGVTEELSFPLITVMMYFGLKAIVNGDGLPSGLESLICGVITGALFWIKFTFVGFSAGFCLYILIYALKKKSFQRLWQCVWKFAAGVLIVSVPVLIYFVANRSLGYLLEAYFYDNLFLYLPKEKYALASIPVISNIVNPVYGLLLTVLVFPVFGILLLLSLVSALFIDKKYRRRVAFLIILTFMMSAGFIFPKSSFIFYYGNLLSYGFGLALIPVIKVFALLRRSVKGSLVLKILASVTLVASFFASLLLSKNLYLLSRPRQSIVQYSFAETIDQTQNAKVLTYEVNDSGFFMAASILPVNRYYSPKYFGDSLPELKEEQERLIEEGYFDYIVTTNHTDCDWENYEMIDEAGDWLIDYNNNNVYLGFRLYRRTSE